THVFMGTDGWIYAVRSDGYLFKNKYNDATGWVGWAQIGSGWNQFTQVFPGADNWIYAERSDGHLFKNKYVDGTGWVGWQEL
ncbi:MAG: tachylectin-related carbohydrate-binding protein, partial [Candidatus Saccharimonadales bacterium]